PIQRQELTNGDVIRVGATVIKFIDDEPRAPEAMAGDEGESPLSRRGGHSMRPVLWGGIGLGLVAGIVIGLWVTGSLDDLLKRGNFPATDSEASAVMPKPGQSAAEVNHPSKNSNQQNSRGDVDQSKPAKPQAAQSAPAATEPEIEYAMLTDQSFA